MSVLKPFSGVISAVQRALDGCLIVAGLYGANMALGHDWTELNTVASLIAVSLFLVGGETRRLYASWRLSSLDEEFRNVLVLWGATCCAVIIGAFLAKVSSSYSRLEMVVWFLVTPALLLFSRIAARAALRKLRAAGRNTRTVAVAGGSSLAATLVARLQDSSTLGMRLLGVFDDASANLEDHDSNRPHLAGSLSELVDKARRGEVDYVFIAFPMRAEQRIVDLVNRMADTTASVYVVPDLFVFDLMRARWVSLGGLPAVSVYESPFHGAASGFLKRLEDVVLGLFFLAIAAVPMAVIALGIKLTSHGSILFKQKRYGLNGRVVLVWKFRTMVSSEDGPVVIQAQNRDPRVTRFGHFLRSMSLDELPQLFNVIRGEMSLVGPRPHAVAHNEEYRRLVHGYMLRHKVKPGITGWAQVNGWRGQTDTVEKMKRRVEHDLEYLRNWSLWFDVKILVLTVAAMFSKKNAH